MRIRSKISCAIFICGIFSCVSPSLAHNESFKDIQRYRLEFKKHIEIKNFIEKMDAFSELQGYTFVKQRLAKKADFYYLTVTNDIFRISCSNINFSLVMHCLDSHLSDVDIESKDREMWNFKAYLRSNGFEPL